MLLGAFAGFLEDVSWFQHFPWHNHFSTHHFGGVWNHLRCSNWRCCYHKGVPEKFGDGRCRFLRVSMFSCFKVLFDVKCEGYVLGCIGTRRQVCLWHWKGSQWHSGAVMSVLGKFWWGHLMFWDCLDRLISFQAKSAPHAVNAASLNSFTSLLPYLGKDLLGLGNANTADTFGR